MTGSISVLGPRGNAISVVGAGSGPVLFLLHGFPLDHRLWLPQLDALSTQYHVIVPELRGFGKSTLTEMPYSLAELADDVDFVRQHLAGSAPIHVCGLSMGGYVALEYVARHRAHLASLILANTKPTEDTPEARQGRIDMAHLAEQAGSWAAVSGMLSKLVGTTTARSRPDVLRAAEAMLRSAAAPSVAMAQRAMAARRDFTTALSSFDFPTLVIAGEEDEICPPEPTRQWASSIAGTRFEVIDQAGHLTPIEAPEAFNARLVAFLEEVGGV